MDISAKWRSGAAWVDFPINDILHMPLNHALDLFNRAIPVVIRQGQLIVSNDKAMRQTYHKKREFTVLALDKVERSEGILQEVGFK